MPTDTGVQDARSGTLDLFRQRDDFVPGLPLRDQVQHRQAIDQDEIVANCLAHTGHNFDRKALAIGEAAAPIVAALVGVGDEELVEKIPLRAHDLDPVVACLARAGGGGHDISDLLFDTCRVQLGRSEGRDRRFNW